MSGSLAMTIRRSGGTEHRLESWTNVFPQIVWRDGFLPERPEVVDRVVEDANVRRPGSSFGLRPSTYGLVVVDFQTRTLVSCQRRCSFDTCLVAGRDPSALVGRMIDDIEAGRPFDDRFFEDGFVAEGLVLHEALRLGLVTRIVEATGDRRILDVRDWSPRRIRDSMGGPTDGRGASWRIHVDVQGWRFVDLPFGRRRGRRECLDVLGELGFQLDVEESASFRRWIRKKWDVEPLDQDAYDQGENG